MNKSIRKTNTTKSKKLGSRVQWENDESIDVCRSLRHTQAKLSRIRSLAIQLGAESPDVSVQDVLRRLQVQRTTLGRRLVDLQKKSQKNLKNFKQTSPQPHFIRGEIALPRLPPGLDLASNIDRFHTQSDPNLPPGFTGYVSPLDVKDQGMIRLDLNHGSMAMYCFYPSEFQLAGYLKINALLCDEAAWWRDDNPDFCESRPEIYWMLPAVPYDSIIDCRVTVKIFADITVAADDGGACFLGVGAANTNPDGAWPDCVPYSTFCWYPFYDSEMMEMYPSFQYSFEAKANTVPGIALALPTQLSAQDGTVSANVTYLVASIVTSDLSLLGAPTLFYTRTPTL